MRDPGDEVGNKSVSPIRDGIGALISLTLSKLLFRSNWLPEY